MPNTPGVRLGAYEIRSIRLLPLASTRLNSLQSLHQMDPVFRLQLNVTPEVVDGNRHVNNVAYVQWMQDAAIGHDQACGGAKLAQELGAAWFVREHRIEYLKPAFLDDEITLLTWVADWRKVRSLRRYRFLRTIDQAVLAEGETQWVFVDATTGRPKTIPDQIASAFGIAPSRSA